MVWATTYQSSYIPGDVMSLWTVTVCLVLLGGGKRRGTVARVQWKDESFLYVGLNCLQVSPLPLSNIYATAIHHPYNSSCCLWWWDSNCRTELHPHLLEWVSLCPPTLVEEIWLSLPRWNSRDTFFLFSQTIWTVHLWGHCEQHDTHWWWECVYHE